MIDKQTAAQLAGFVSNALNQAFGGGGLDLLIKLQAEVNEPEAVEPEETPNPS